MRNKRDDAGLGATVRPPEGGLAVPRGGGLEMHPGSMQFIFDSRLNSHRVEVQ